MSRQRIYSRKSEKVDVAGHVASRANKKHVVLEIMNAEKSFRMREVEQQFPKMHKLSVAQRVYNEDKYGLDAMTPESEYSKAYKTAVKFFNASKRIKNELDAE